MEKLDTELSSLNVPLNGQIFVRTYDGEGGEVVCIYGDPLGLKSLALKLSALADLKQTRLSDQQLPVDEGFHLHITPNNGLHKKSLKLSNSTRCTTFQLNTYSHTVNSLR